VGLAPGNDRLSVLDSLPPMAPSSQHSARQDAPCFKQGRVSSANPLFTFHASRFTIPLVLLCLLGTACSTGQTGKVLFEDQRGAVSLHPIPDESIQASHPIDLDPTLLAKILKGIGVQDQERGIQRILAGPSASVPVFSDAEIQFLAPLLAEGLRTATPDQRIEYRVQTTHEGSMLESSTTETTAGSLYAYGRSLFIILSQYRYSPMRANLNLGDMAYRSRPPDSSGLRNRILLFTPSAAERSDAFDPPTGGKTTDRFIAVDFQMLQQAPTAVTSTPQVDQTTPPTREAPVGARVSDPSAHSTEALAQEVEALRKELQSVQQQLGNQPTRQDSPKKKTAPAKK
jgi:hypothetical protein